MTCVRNSKGQYIFCQQYSKTTLIMNSFPAHCLIPGRCLRSRQDYRDSFKAWETCPEIIGIYFYISLWSFEVLQKSNSFIGKNPAKRVRPEYAKRPCCEVRVLVQPNCICFWSSFRTFMSNVAHRRPKRRGCDFTRLCVRV